MRIVAGKLAGRRIPAPPPGVRPTMERVREALMSILGPSWEGRQVLDAFAGTGSLGLEAISRGAAHATFVEVDGPSCRRIADLAERFGVADQVTVRRGDIRRVLEQLAAMGQRFDVIFLDPPWIQDLLPFLEEILAGCARVLAPGGRITADYPRDAHPAVPPGLDLLDVRRYGGTTVAIYGPAEAEEAGS